MSGIKTKTKYVFLINHSIVIEPNNFWLTFRGVFLQRTDLRVYQIKTVSNYIFVYLNIEDTGAYVIRDKPAEKRKLEAMIQRSYKELVFDRSGPFSHM